MEKFWAEFIEKFKMAFVTGDRWKLYLQGMGTTLGLTITALVIGVFLGVLVAVIRSAHDQQRPGRRSAGLAVVNAVCKLYTTVIRGTPMLVQLLIWGFVIFKTSRNRFLVGMLGLGINSGAYVAEIVRGGLMSVDAGQSEAGLQKYFARFGQRVHRSFQGYLSGFLHRRGGNFILCRGGGGQNLRVYVPLSWHCFYVSGVLYTLYLASGKAGKEAEAK